MKQLKSSQRQYLKGKAHHLKPVVQIGKSGVTDSLISEIDKALDAHELIKVRFVESREEKKELTEEIVERLEAVRVGMVGNIAMLYREHKDPEKRKIVIPES